MIRATQLTVSIVAGRLYDEGVYTVTVDDEGAGEYLVIEENQDTGNGKIRVDAESWPELRDAVERLLKEIGE